MNMAFLSTAQLSSCLFYTEDKSHSNKNSPFNVGDHMLWFVDSAPAVNLW